MENQFPQVNDYFSVVCIRHLSDASYRAVVFRCLAIDDKRLVGQRLSNHSTKHDPVMFYRPDWRFDQVSDEVVLAMHPTGFVENRVAVEAVEKAGMSGSLLRDATSTHPHTLSKGSGRVPPGFG
jgi:hypothetical protein